MDMQFEEFWNQLTIIVYWTCTAIIFVGTIVLIISYAKWKKAKKACDEFDRKIREMFFEKYGHYNYFKKLEDLEKDAEKIKKLKGE